MAARSAGILLYRRGETGVEVWIAHMGGPFWAHKDEGGWSIPKGLVDEGEDDMAAAQREFAEEMGSPAPEADYERLGEFTASGKTIVVFAAEAAFDPAEIHSDTFELEWPPHSGRVRRFAEVDAAGWHPVADARLKLTKGSAASARRVAEGTGRRGPALTPGLRGIAIADGSLVPWRRRSRTRYASASNGPRSPLIG
nr:NUDIX domain-containing protein [Leifsonia xyli]